jgi:hypothetical protein
MADGAACMEMPETAVDVDHLAPKREYNVRPAWKVAPMQPEAIAEAVQQPAHSKFWLGILSPNARHMGASLRWR